MENHVYKSQPVLWSFENHSYGFLLNSQFVKSFLLNAFVLEASAHESLFTRSLGFRVCTNPWRFGVWKYNLSWSACLNFADLAITWEEKVEGCHGSIIIRTHWLFRRRGVKGCHNRTIMHSIWAYNATNNDTCCGNVGWRRQHWDPPYCWEF